MATATKERASAATATKKKQQHETDTPPKPPAPPPRTLAPPSSLPNLDRLRSLVAAFAPVLRLHPDDAFNPCSAEWFASRCSLWDDGGGEKKCLAGLGECSLRLAVEKQRELIKQGGTGGRRRIRLQLDPLARGGQRFEELDERVPLYVRAHLVVPPPPPPPTCCGEEVSLRPRLEVRRKWVFFLPSFSTLKTSQLIQLSLFSLFLCPLPRSPTSPSTPTTGPTTPSRRPSGRGWGPTTGTWRG